MPFDACIFDLDDTLLDTSGLLLAPAHAEACAAMIAAGLDVPQHELLELRLRLHRERPRDDLDRLLAEHYRANAVVVDAARKAFFERPVPPLPVNRPLRAMLKRLCRRCTLLLVTGGHPPTQAQKLRRLMIREVFHEIVYVPAGADKQPAFEALAARRRLDPPRTLVVGDRIDSEIAAGKALGMLTARVLGGEYGLLQPAGPAEQADWEIDDVLQIERIIENS